MYEYVNTFIFRFSTATPTWSWCGRAAGCVTYECVGCAHVAKRPVAHISVSRRIFHFSSVSVFFALLSLFFFHSCDNNKCLINHMEGTLSETMFIYFDAVQTASFFFSGRLSFATLCSCCCDLFILSFQFDSRFFSIYIQLKYICVLHVHTMCQRDARGNEIHA